jgi:hypothetical protein
VSPNPPAPFVASGARPGEVEEVTALIQTVELAQDGEVETTAAVREDWASADLSRDVLLVRESERLVAYGHVAPFVRGA